MPFRRSQKPSGCLPVAQDHLCPEPTSPRTTKGESVSLPVCTRLSCLYRSAYVLMVLTVLPATNGYSASKSVLSH